jgi:phosphatidylserine/phosphatidylglycerophosphate/cardiolipin synthase-like enzyme
LEPTADRKLISRYNREWHIVIENRELAECFGRYLQHDFKTAQEAPESVLEAGALMLPNLRVSADELIELERAGVALDVFPPTRFVFGKQNPLTVQPILTPDNYLKIILGLLRQKPAERLYFQNQSLNPVKTPTPDWAELLHLLAHYSQDQTLDVRIIFRNIGPIRKKLESLQATGFNMDRVRIQGACHTKGIIIDSATVLLGSHNWTNQGVQANRDASLLIRNSDIARYYEKVFLHDWERLARPTIREESMPVPIEPGLEAKAMEDPRYRLIPWSAWEEE